MVFSFELENNVLKGLLQHQDEWHRFDTILSEADFNSTDSKVNPTIFKMIRNALNNSEAIDDTILIDRINGLKISFPDSINISDYIQSLYTFPISKQVFETSVKELKKFTIRRELLNKYQNAIKFLNKPDPNLSYSEIIEEVDKLHNQTISSFELGSDKIVNLGAIAEQIVEDRGNNPPKNVGLMSPYPTVNKIYGSLLRYGNMTCIAARAKVGKELANYEKVLTPNGWVNHGDIKVGDKVITPKGKTANVIGYYPHPQKDVYRFSFADGRTVDAGLEHLWNVYGRHDGGNWKYKVVNTEEIIKMLSMPSKAKKTYIDLIDNIGDTEDKKLPIDPYCLGAILGDGGLSDGSVHIYCGDVEVIDIIQSRMTCGKRTQQKGCEKITISTKSENYSFFEKSGLKGCLSGDKFIPEEYINASRNQKLELIRGLFDTDGHVSKNGHVEFYTKSPKMALQIQEILWSLGCFCKITKKIPTINGKPYAVCHRLKVRHRDPSILFSLKRKKGRAVRTKECRLRIDSVIKLDKKEDCSCIKIDDVDSLYITSNYIVTHNTSIILDFLLKVSYENQITILHFDNGEMSEEELVFRMVSAVSGVPIHLLESGKWRTHGYKDFTAKEVVDKVRGVWNKMKNIKILYQNVAGMSAEEMVSLMKRIYYSEVGRGNKMIFSFDYIKTDFSNLGKGSDWAFVGKLIHAFKQTISRELKFDGEPCVAMVTSVQTNRSGIVNGKTSDEVTDNESVIGLSDNIIQFVSHLFLLRKKTLDELVTEGEHFGTHKLICLAARHLGEDVFGHLNPVEMPDDSKKNNFINLEFDNFNVTDKGDLRDIVAYMNHEDVQVKQTDDQLGLPDF